MNYTHSTFTLLVELNKSIVVDRQALSIMPSQEGPVQKMQRQNEDSATIGDIIDFTDMRMLEAADKDQQFFDTQSVSFVCVQAYICVCVCVVCVCIAYVS